MLTILGFLCYYVAPTAFFQQNYKLFLIILNVVLLLMILVMTFIAVLLQPYIENLLIKFWLSFVCKRDRKL